VNIFKKFVKKVANLTKRKVAKVSGKILFPKIKGITAIRSLKPSYFCPVDL